MEFVISGLSRTTRRSTSHQQEEEDSYLVFVFGSLVVFLPHYSVTFMFIILIELLQMSHSVS